MRTGRRCDRALHRGPRHAGGGRALGGSGPARRAARRGAARIRPAVAHLRRRIRRARSRRAGGSCSDAASRRNSRSARATRVLVVIAQGNVTPAGVAPRMRRFTVAGFIDAGMYEFDQGLALRAYGRRTPALPPWRRASQDCATGSTTRMPRGSVSVPSPRPCRAATTSATGAAARRNFFRSIR